MALRAARWLVDLRALRPSEFVVALKKGKGMRSRNIVMTDAVGQIRRHKVVGPILPQPERIRRDAWQPDLDFPLCNKSFNLSYTPGMTCNDRSSILACREASTWRSSRKVVAETSVFI